MNDSSSTTLKLIAVFKLFKSVMLILLGISALKMLHADASATLDRWISAAGINPDNPYLDKALEKVASLPPVKFKEFGIASFVYAGLFLIEGTGLWLQKRWAEWFTVVITGSLVPVELYELYRHPTPGKGVMLVVNVAVVVYLLLRITRDRK